MGAAAGESGEDQIALGVGDREAPLGAVLVPAITRGDLGEHRAPTRDLTGVFVVAHQGAQPNPYFPTSARPDREGRRGRGGRSDPSAG